VTAEVAAFVGDRGDGLLHIFVPHATAGIAILETGPGATMTCSPRSPTCFPPTIAGATDTVHRDTAGPMCCLR
jgi:hypothetical protein